MIIKTSALLLMGLTLPTLFCQGGRYLCGCFLLYSGENLFLQD